MTLVPLLMVIQAQTGPPGWWIFAQMGAIVLIIYWLLIRPQRKERDRHEAMVAALQKGDEVASAGGIIGTIVHVEDDRVTVKTAENTRIVLERSRVSRLMSGPTDAAPKGQANP